ncbi:hypothetical protein [Bdellovibrio sp. HCB337]|uniref:hypothetical protein n=1 Tax=Bdellovibrio sp. HCB337 TaxID=3394358 RepID=UPI0039A6653C
MKTTMMIAAMMLFAQASFAECELITTRKACPGKETEALKPYDGKNPTTEKVTADSEDACLKKAEKASKIIRKGTLTEKSVTAKFGGKDLGKTFSDKVDCK